MATAQQLPLIQQALEAIFDKATTLKSYPAGSEVGVTVQEIDPSQFLALASVADCLCCYPTVSRSGANVTVKFYC